MAGERLQTLIQRQAVLDSEAFHKDSSNGNVTWDEIWQATLEDGLFTTDTQGSNKILLVAPSRRGPGTTSDVDTFERTVATTGITTLLSPRIPYALTGQMLGYTIYGLPLNEQTEILSSIGVESLNGQMHLNASGTPLLGVAQQKNAERIWTREGVNVTVSDFREIADRWLGITNVPQRVSSKIIDQLPNDCTLEQALVTLTNQALELALKEAGHQVTISTEPLPTKPNTVQQKPAESVENALRTAILSATSHKQTPWYPHFEGAVKKMIKDRQITTAEAVSRIWHKASSRIVQIGETLNFSPSKYLADIATGTPQDQAFFEAVENRANLGSILLDQTSEAIRIARLSGSDKFNYVPGKIVFGSFLDELATDPTMAIGLQPFEARSETGFMLNRLSAIVAQRGRPIPAIVILSNDVERLDHSIFEALSEL